MTNLEARERLYHCGRKRRHRTRGEAREAIDRIRSSPHFQENADSRLCEYRCRYCGGFHVGNERKDRCAKTKSGS